MTARSRKAEIARAAAAIYQIKGTDVYDSLLRLLDHVYEECKDALVSCEVEEVRGVQAKAQAIQELKKLISREPLAPME